MLEASNFQALVGVFGLFTIVVIAARMRVAGGFGIKGILKMLNSRKPAPEEH